MRGGCVLEVVGLVVWVGCVEETVEVVLGLQNGARHNKLEWSSIVIEAMLLLRAGGFGRSGLVSGRSAASLVRWL